MNPQPILTLNRLAKRYGDKTVFTDVSLSLDAGSHALVGPNGIGKTTLLATIAGIETPSAGDIMIDGVSALRHPLDYRRKLAWVPDKPECFPFLKGREFLEFCAAAHGVDDTGRINELLGGFGIETAKEVAFQAMSLGTRRKFFLVAALTANPRALVLDEPTVGLDAQSVRLLEELVLQRGDMLTLASTHDELWIAATSARRIDAKSLMGVSDATFGI